MRYRIIVPSGWEAFPAEGDRHYDEYRSPSVQAAVRVFAFESSATTLEDIISDDLAGIRAHEGAVIDGQSETTLMNGTPAHRIEYSITAEDGSRHGVDVMAVLDDGSVLVSMVSEEPVSPALLATFNGMIDSLFLETSG